MSAFSSEIIIPDSILDLGAGTGLLTKMYYDIFPSADYTLVDISEDMLTVAKKRFNGLPNFKFITSDYSSAMPDGRFDFITSALSIHHLSEQDKAALYKNIFSILPDHGVFINFDQFCPASPVMNDLYNKWWYAEVIKTGLSNEEFEKWMERRKIDKENTVDETKQMLIDAGFAIVECIYSYMKFGVIIAIK